MKSDKKIVFSPEYVIHCPFITKELILILILEYKTFQQNPDFSKPIFFVDLRSYQTKTASKFSHP